MQRIIFHGRGGQGAVTAAEVMVMAAYYEGKYAQSFPSFGFERRGAPVMAFLRLDERPIRLRGSFEEADCIIVLDARLPDVVKVDSNLVNGGVAVFNTSKAFSELNLQKSLSLLATVDANAISNEIFGVTSIARTNTAMLGALARCTGWVSVDSICKALAFHFSGGLLEKNLQAVRLAFEKTKVIKMEQPGQENSQKDSRRDLEVNLLSPRKINLEIFLAPVTNEVGGTKTGSWRTYKPVFNHHLCNKCGTCAMYCPEGVINETVDGFYVADYDYCKGCGVCIANCPKEAIENVLER